MALHGRKWNEIDAGIKSNEAKEHSTLSGSEKIFPTEGHANGQKPVDMVIARSP